MADFLGSNALRWVELLFALGGIILSCCGQRIFVSLLIIFAITFIYLLTVLICTLTSRISFSRPMQAILEAMLGLILLLFTIYFLAKGEAGEDAFSVTCVVFGFLLTALLFITAYEKT